MIDYLSPDDAVSAMSVELKRGEADLVDRSSEDKVRGDVSDIKEDSSALAANSALRAALELSPLALFLTKPKLMVNTIQGYIVFILMVGKKT